MKQTSHQRFVARVELARAADKYEYLEEATALGQLCADDPRLHGLWALTENMPDDKFGQLIADLLMAVDTAATPMEERDAYAAALENTQKAATALQALREIPGVWRQEPSVAGVADGLVRKCWPPDAPPLDDCLQWLKMYLANRKAALTHGAQSVTVSRQARSTRFIGEATAFLPPDIVADLVSLLYGVELEPASVRKQSERYIKGLDC